MGKQNAPLEEIVLEKIHKSFTALGLAKDDSTLAHYIESGSFNESRYIIPHIHLHDSVLVFSVRKYGSRRSSYLARVKLYAQNPEGFFVGGQDEIFDSPASPSVEQFEHYFHEMRRFVKEVSLVRRIAAKHDVRIVARYVGPSVSSLGVFDDLRSVEIYLERAVRTPDDVAKIVGAAKEYLVKGKIWRQYSAEQST